MSQTINKLDQKAWSYIKQQNSENTDRKAIVDGAYAYTYGDMFAKWDSYAKVFTALGMTGKNHARVGMLGSTSAETVFAFYGLNMVGAEISMFSTVFSFNKKKILSTIESEKITDLILADDFAQPPLIYELLMKKQSLGLNNVIVLHVPIAGRTVDQMMTYGQEYKYAMMKQWFYPVCMDTLIRKYASTSIEVADQASCDRSVIVHTSGTTSGIGKPIPLSDKAFNYMGNCYDTMESFAYLKEGLISTVSIDLGNAYGIVNQVHAPLAVGGTVAFVPAGAFNPQFYKSFPEFKTTILFTTAALIEMWMKQENPSMDYSSLKCVVVGGSSVSSKDKQRYIDFMGKYGGKNIMFLNGYGLSELGGACILSTPDLNDESIGYALPGVEVYLYNEEQEKFLTMEDIPCEGVLYLRSDAMTIGELDGKQIVKTEEIDGKRFLCTNDYVRIDETGKIFFKGRANRYFINNEGIKYDAGKVENEISGQDNIEGCCVVPFYVKPIHDNVPMLCVKPRVEGAAAAESIRLMLLKVFSVECALEADQLPSRVMIVDELPRNANGKIDLYRITNGGVKGTQFTVEPVKLHDKITDIALVPVINEEDDMIQETMKSIAKDIMDSNAEMMPCANGSPLNTMAGMATQYGNQMKNALHQMNTVGRYYGQQFTPYAYQYGAQNVQLFWQMMSAHADQAYWMTRQIMDIMYQQNRQLLGRLAKMK